MRLQGWSSRHAGLSHPSSWALVTQDDCAPCGAGLSAPAQDPWVLVKNAGYGPRMTGGEFLISPIQCGQGVTINHRVKSAGAGVGSINSAMKRSEALT